MSKEKTVWDTFDTYRLFSNYKELDALLKDIPLEFSLEVKRMGTFEFRKHPPVSGNFLRYKTWYITNDRPNLPPRPKKAKATDSQENK